MGDLKFLLLDLNQQIHRESILEVLQLRLPQSCHVFNSIKVWPKWSERNSIYTIGQHDGNTLVNEASWIIVKSYREDRGADISISCPKELYISDDIRTLFTDGGLIDWDKPYLFPATDRRISKMIFEISGYIKSNGTRFFPCHMFYSELDEALEYDIPSLEQNIRVDTLDLTQGVPFILKEWKYSSVELADYLKHVISHNDTMGIYASNQLVCGAATHVNGIIGMLNTKEGFRRKGYAQMCMRSLMKRLAEKELIPCSAAEICNPASVKLHEKLGMKISHTVDYIGSDGKIIAEN